MVSQKACEMLAWILCLNEECGYSSFCENSEQSVALVVAGVWVHA